MESGVTRPGSLLLWCSKFPLLHKGNMARLATLSLLLATAALGADTKPFNAAAIRGLNPACEFTTLDLLLMPDVDKYEITTGQFTCLDGSNTISVTAINDDYCDCKDGSDEPGTSACEGQGEGWFYCKNEGHVPGRVRTSRVGDGICGESQQLQKRK